MPRPSTAVPCPAVGRAVVDVSPAAQPTGFVLLREGKHGPVWYAKYRLPDGRQVNKRIGPAWTRGGRAPEGRLTGARPRCGATTCSGKLAAAPCPG